MTSALPFTCVKTKAFPSLGDWAVTTNDHMMSFYMRTPSGFDIEYGWGGREVDDSIWQVQYHTSGSMWGHRPLTR